MKDAGGSGTTEMTAPPAAKLCSQGATASGPTVSIMQSKLPAVFRLFVQQVAQIADASRMHLHRDDVRANCRRRATG